MLKSEDQKILEEALKDITKRIENDEPLSPDTNEDLDVLYTYAHSLYQAQNYAKAKVIFHRLLLSKPLEQAYWFGFAASLQLEGNLQEALSAWGMTSILKAEDPTPHFHAAECCFALGNSKEGQEALKTAKRLLTEDHSSLSSKIATFENERLKHHG